MADCGGSGRTTASCHRTASTAPLLVPIRQRSKAARNRAWKRCATNQMSLTMHVVGRNHYTECFQGFRNKLIYFKLIQLEILCQMYLCSQVWCDVLGNCVIIALVVPSVSNARDRAFDKAQTNIRKYRSRILSKCASKLQRPFRGVVGPEQPQIKHPGRIWIWRWSQHK